MTYSEDLALAHALADLADEITLDRFRAQDLKIETKPDSSPVTDADQATERALKSLLADKRPDDALIGEEYGTSGEATRTWIIDPIDGTANYMRGVPVWATLIALAIDGKPTVSVVSAPALGRRWWGAPNIGAWTRDIDGTEREINVSAIADVAHASLSYNNLKLWDESGKLPQLIEFSRKLWRTRAYGDFYSYMLLVEGSVDIVAEHDLKIYDIAALVPIVEQAGGKLTALDGPLTAETSSVLATNGKLHSVATSAFL
ncbi:MAG: inositol monophosphatase family protein [Micrococcales bacterium]